MVPAPVEVACREPPRCVSSEEGVPEHPRLLREVQAVKYTPTAERKACAILFKVVTSTASKWLCDYIAISRQCGCAVHVVYLVSYLARVKCVLQNTKYHNDSTPLRLI